MKSKKKLVHDIIMNDMDAEERKLERVDDKCGFCIYNRGGCALKLISGKRCTHFSRRKTV